jgi:hypothetical protein
VYGSVEYVSVTLTGGTNPTIAANVAIPFNQINCGNIPYSTSTGYFTLSAGKTYELTGGVRMSDGGGTGDFAWMNASNQIIGGNYGGASTINGSTGICQVIYTPTASTTVKLAPTASQKYTAGTTWGGTYATIRQVGTSMAATTYFTYSSTEKYTGKTWIDGKAIYSKYVDLSAYGNSAAVATGVTKLISQLGEGYDGSNYYTLPYFAADGLYYLIRQPAGDVVIRRTGVWPAAGRTGDYVVIEYTK